jgi:hypothetical protein
LLPGFESKALFDEAFMVPNPGRYCPRLCYGGKPADAVKVQREMKADPTGVVYLAVHKQRLVGRMQIPKTNRVVAITLVLDPNSGHVLAAMDSDCGHNNGGWLVRDQEHPLELRPSQDWKF